MHDWNDDRIFQRACAGLARLGHEVYLIASGEEGKKDEEVMGVHIKYVELRKGWRRRWYSSQEVVDKAIAVKADIYQFHDPDILPHFHRIKKALPNSKIIYDIHENYAGRFAHWGLPAFLGKYFRFYELNRIKKMDGITVVSKSMMQLFDKAGTPSEITRNSVDLERLRKLDLNLDKSETPIVMTSGSHSHERHCLQTVQSIKYVSQEVKSDFIFQFAGRYVGEMKEEMQIQADTDGTSEKLKLDGMLPWEENFGRLVKSYCGCVFYRNTPNNRVGIPNRLFEYMYCGLPIIASDFPELRAIVEDSNCGILVDSENPEDIAKGISFLLNNPEKSKEMGENGRKAVEEKYGYHNDLKLLVNFYNSL